MDERRYRVGDLLRGDHRVLAVHRGHFGMVYVCRQDLPGGGRVYKAIKTFRRGGTGVSRSLFDRELSFWVRLDHHPNVVQAKDADTVRKHLVLEFVPGPSLREVADRSPIAPVHFMRWAREIAEGLRFLHVENGFLHRDLRPANILVDTAHGLRAKISDLGIGKPFDPDAASNTVIGTFNYMAPEVFRGLTDFRSDIFSYGATLYYLLTGRYASPRSTNEARPVVPPGEFAPGVPDRLCKVVLACLQREPERRYPSIGDVITDLDGIREWRPVLPYRSCREHGYAYFAQAAVPGCPFCRYAAAFRVQEGKLDRVLAAGEAGH